MEEERLNHLLRGLPREPASEGFTARVLRRLDEPAQGKQPRGSYPQGWHRLHRAQRVHRMPPMHRWHPMTAAIATMAALGVSVALLQRESPPPGPLAAVATTAADPRDQAGTPAGRLAAYPSERALIRAAVASPADGFAGGEREIGMPGGGWPRSGGAGGPGELGERAGNGKRLSSAQAHLILREMQLERAGLERELQSLSRADRGYGTPPAVVYLGGDENVDLVLSTGRARAPGRPVERDGGDFNNFLD
jgi:hypothetical protein